MENFQIRNTLEDDFVEIAELTENCSPMETERNTIYHIFTKLFTSNSLVTGHPSVKMQDFF